MFTLIKCELIIVPKVLGSPRPTEDKASVGTMLVVSSFGPKVDYVPCRTSLVTTCRCLKKPALLDVPSDDNMYIFSHVLLFC